jgi:hypothetical protein
MATQAPLHEQLDQLATRLDASGNAAMGDLVRAVTSQLVLGQLTPAQAQQRLEALLQPQKAQPPPSPPSTDQFQPPSSAHRGHDRFERVAEKALTAAAIALGLTPSQLDLGRSVRELAQELGVSLTFIEACMKQAIKRAWPRAGAWQVQWLFERLLSHRTAVPG